MVESTRWIQFHIFLFRRGGMVHMLFYIFIQSWGRGRYILIYSHSVLGVVDISLYITSSFEAWWVYSYIFSSSFGAWWICSHIFSSSFGAWWICSYIFSSSFGAWWIYSYIFSSIFGAWWIYPAFWPAASKPAGWHLSHTMSNTWNTHCTQCRNTWNTAML